VDGLAHLSVQMVSPRGLREHCRLAALFADWVQADAEFELAAPVVMGVVCFRARSGAGPEAADDLQERLVEAVNGGGEAHLMHTRLRGRIALRIALGNILTTEHHLADVWSAIRANPRCASRGLHTS
jgi:aromatic-L-amino-acid decarboxylase